MSDRRPPTALIVLAAGAVVIAALLVFSLFATRPSSAGTETDLSSVSQLVANRQVASARILDVDDRIVLVTSASAPTPNHTYWAALRSGGLESATLVGSLVASGAAVQVKQQTGKHMWITLSQFILPLLLLADLFGLFILLARGGAGQIKELFAFSRIGNRRTTAAGSTTRFSHVAGLGEAVEELAEVRDYLAAPYRFARLGALPPKGVLLFGPPGCGKTLLAKALAGETGVAFFTLSGSEFVESLVGVGAARVRDLFVKAKSVAPAVVFIDELDAAGRKRGAGIGGGHDEREQTLNEMLVQMDGFDPSLGVVVIGATNRPDILDPALLRPGRFDRQVCIDLPDLEGRQQILAVHAKGRPLDSGVSLGAVAAATPGFTGADLANVLNEAALLAVRRKASTISADDLGEAIERVIAGPRRRGRLLTEAELRRLAYHEAGHAVVAASVGLASHIRRISIVARGRNAAHADIVRSDRGLLTRDELLAELAVVMGGVAAEELAADQPSTAGESDVERATELARDIVGRFGMSPAVGRMRVLGPQAEVFLGRDYLSTQHLSSQTLARMDEAVGALIEDAEERARAILSDRLDTLHALTDALLQEETLDRAELASILGGVQVP